MSIVPTNQNKAPKSRAPPKPLKTAVVAVAPNKKLPVHKNPNEKTINRMMTGICRCGTYPRIRKAIRKAAKLMEKAKVILLFQKLLMTY